MKQKKLKTICKFWIFSLAMLFLFLQGCATKKTPPVDPLAYKSRMKSITNEGVAVTVAVPTISEAQAIYGVELASKYIQPVWVEVKNDSTDTYWFLFTGLDPDYFFPSEAAFALKTDDEKFQKLQFKNPIRPRSTQSGFVLVNLDEGYKAVDIDLISRKEVKSFSFIIADPEFKADSNMVDFESLYKAEDIINIEDEEELRKKLEELPMFTTNADGNEHGDPLNLVLIGEINDIMPALVRRNWHATETTWSGAITRTIKSFLKGERYRYSPISPLYVFGRPQDKGWQKARSTINERNHMRFWLSPIRFRGKKVIIGQISRDIGVKFTLKSPTISTHVIDPDVDEARRYFLEDLAYSQAIARFAFVKGVGVVNKEEPRMNLVGDPFYTDGLRAVLFFEPRPYTISDINFLNWEAPSGSYGVSKQE
ncbi:MAG: LssY C-terminal domain-containing protein [Desulfobacterales bacterium]